MHMPKSHHRLLICALVLQLAALSTSQAQERHMHGDTADPLAAEAPFISENDAAMDKMMAGMDVKPSGDVDRDFVAMMSAHHQGAIDMALSILKYGHNEQLKRIAQEIIVDQQQEIAAMALAVGQPLPPSVASPTQGPAQSPAQPPAQSTTPPSVTQP
jgi:uncharacterized protein (DUF305 family)